MNTTRSLPFASSSFVFGVLGLLVACSGTQGNGFVDSGMQALVDSGVKIDTGMVSQIDTGTVPFDAGMVSTDTGVVGPTDTGVVGFPDSPPGEGSTGQCAPNCMTDQDCQNSCPAVAGALNCCDVGSGVCFTSSEAMCPDMVTDSGTTPTGDSGSAY